MLRKKDTSVHMFAQISKEVLRFFTGPSRQGRDLDVHT